MLARLGFTRLATLAIALAAVCLWASPALAIPPDPNPLPGDNFQGGDGDQNSPGGGVVDWQDATGTITQDDPNASDDIFFAGNKETVPDAWTFGKQSNGTNPPKDNVFVFWRNPVGDASNAFLRLAFKREHPPGNTYLTFELNKSAGSWTNSAGTTIPCRSDGDLLVSYEVTPSGDPVTIRVYTWDGGGGPVECPDGASGTLTDTLGPLNNPLAEAAVNFQGDIPNYLDPSTYGDTFIAGTFGEASLNLSAIVTAAGGDPCESGFQQVHMHSRSSVAIDSDLQDYIAPVSAAVDPCPVTPPPPPPPPPAEVTPPPPPPPAAAVLPEDVSGTLPETIRSAAARLSAPAGCVGRSFVTRVRGRRISSVTFYVDGKRIKVDKKASFFAKIDSRRYSAGVHRITAKVRFKANSSPRTKTLRGRFLRCVAAVAPPRFTG